MVPGLLALTLGGRPMMTKKSSQFSLMTACSKNPYKKAPCSISIRKHAQNPIVQIEGQQ